MPLLHLFSVAVSWRGATGPDSRSRSFRRDLGGPSVIVGATQFAIRDEVSIDGGRALVRHLTMRRQDRLPLRKRGGRDEEPECLAVASDRQDLALADEMPDHHVVVIIDFPDPFETERSLQIRALVVERRRVQSKGNRA